MAANNERIQKIQSLVKKGDWKKAYKEAKFSSKLSESPELKLLVITSLWNWIKDQVKRKQYEDAKLNVRELVNSNINTIPANIRNEFPAVFLLLGLNSLLPDDLKNDTTSADVQIQLIDQYLIHNIKSNDILPVNLTAAEQIKEALKLIESRQDQKALELLTSIQFRSPASEWRLLLRGLIAHYNGDEKTADENWQRLNNTRPTGKIAANLQNLFKDKNTTKTNDDIVRQFNLFNDRSGSEQSRKIDLIDNLRIIGDCMKSQKYKEVLVRLPTIRQIAADQNALMYGRILRLIHIHLLENAPPTIIRQFVEQNLPLPIDPNGNRTFALLLDKLAIKEDKEIPAWLRHADTNHYWEKFADEDVDQIESFSPQMKARAKAIALQSAIKYRNYIFVVPEDMVLREFGDDGEKIVNALKQENITWFNTYYNKALNADPTYIPISDDYKSYLQKLMSESNTPEEYAPLLDNLYHWVAERNLDDIKLLYDVFDRCFKGGNFVKAAEYMSHIEKINPLAQNTTYRKMIITEMQCQQALNDGDLAKAKKLLDIIENIPTPDTMFHRYNLFMLALKYIYYVNDKKPLLAKKVLASCKNYGIDKPTPIIFTIITTQIKLTQQAFDNLQKQLNETINTQKNSTVIAAVCDLLTCTINNMTANGNNKFQLPDMMTRILKNNLHNLTKFKWKKDKDIFCVCLFMWHIIMNNAQKIFAEKYEFNKVFTNLARKGRKLFPISMAFKFFEMEAVRLKYVNLLRFLKPTGIRSLRCQIKEINKKYHEFLGIYGKLKDNPELRVLIQYAEERAKCSIPEAKEAIEKQLQSKLPPDMSFFDD
ncbi:MAG: hypothetical protein LBT09_13725 [Planctomycetaceae bacterium]|jgi:hypothetical protein|nr:hypothetical protein [Planctomycetaceae bacterium]